MFLKSILDGGGGPDAKNIVAFGVDVSEHEDSPVPIEQRRIDEAARRSEIKLADVVRAIGVEPV
jgi:hypothetical protein